MTGDLIDALTELHGVTITVRHELKPEAMRLMATLGVQVVVDPKAPPCERITLKNDGTPDRVSHHPCPRCRRVERGLPA